MLESTQVVNKSQQDNLSPQVTTSQLKSPPFKKPVAGKTRSAARFCMCRSTAILIHLKIRWGEMNCKRMEKEEESGRRRVQEPAVARLTRMTLTLTALLRSNFTAPHHSIRVPPITSHAMKSMITLAEAHSSLPRSWKSLGWSK